ncbi:putative PEP-binding protein [Streptomyces sp. NPDC087226]|uniref:putative PEP-binding protein n=1 Tax=Streptomyces sp. NPDC087226 TaxID=3365771 RepID=UPI0038244933
MSQQYLLELLSQVATGSIPPEKVLEYWDETMLDELLADRLVDVGHRRPVATGRSRRAGAASACLVLDPGVAAAAESAGIPYVYAVYDGTAEDFPAIRKCAGFLTPNPAPSAFAAVQAVSDNRPTVIAVPGEIVADTSVPAADLVLTGPNGFTLNLPDQTHRVLRLRDQDGVVVSVTEGQAVSLDATDGAVYDVPSRTEPTPVGTLNRLLTGIGEGEDVHLDGEQAARIRALLDEPAVRGFEMVKQAARDRAPLHVYTTAHTPEGVAAARIPHTRIDETETGIRVRPGGVTIGLLRDERMWSSPRQLDLLRLVLLGRGVLGEERFAEARSAYLTTHTARLRDVIAGARGELSIIRTLCMPGNKLFPSGFDAAGFAGRHRLDPRAVAAAAASWYENETYQGCRGMRVFSQRPDVAELWLEAVLGAAAELAEQGRAPRVRLLLATITLPAEARLFLDLLDRVAPRVLGEHTSVVEGVSIMLETIGAAVRLEDFLGLTCDTARLDGLMIGSNDFTAACLNFHREDAARTIIPGYVSMGLLAHSPFEHIDEEVVGPAVLDALRRAGKAGRDHHPRVWGLGGELAGDWYTVQWLVRNAVPLGLRYVTTAPQNMLTSLFASAQAAITAGGEAA